MCVNRLFLFRERAYIHVPLLDRILDKRYIWPLTEKYYNRASLVLRQNVTVIADVCPIWWKFSITLPPWCYILDANLATHHSHHYSFTYHRIVNKQVGPWWIKLAVCLQTPRVLMLFWHPCTRMVITNTILLTAGKFNVYLCHKIYAHYLLH